MAGNTGEARTSDPQTAVRVAQSHTLQGPPSLWKECALSVPSGPVSCGAVAGGQVFGWQRSWVAVWIGKKVPGRVERSLCLCVMSYGTNPFSSQGLSFP